MKNLLERIDTDIISRLFFRLLPVQVLLIAIGAANSIVDGAVAGQYIDATTVGVVGLYFSMINVLNAIGNTLLGGTAVLCGRYMGAGDIDRTKKVFSLNLLLTFLVGAVLTAVSFLFASPLAGLLGASEELRPALMLYIIGYGIGIIPQLMGQQLSSFLQMERQSMRSYIGIVAMLICNIVADLLFVAVLKMGVFGLALATALCNWIYFLILGQYYLTKKAQLRFTLHDIDWKEAGPMLLIGAPGALLVLCLAIRGLILNRILLLYAGNDGLSAMAAYNMVSGLFLAYCLGAGSVVRMLGSVFFGEEDIASLRRLCKVIFTHGMIITTLVAVVITAACGGIARVFFPDTASHVYVIAAQLMRIYAACIPLIYICCIFSNYMQAAGHNWYVRFLSVFDGLISNILPTLLLAPVMGVLGIWIAGPIGIFLTALMTPLYCIFYWKRMPRTLEEWLFLPPTFGVSEEDRIDIRIRDGQEVAQTAVRVQAFCEAHDMPAKAAYYAALCLEEMAGNVVDHGFHKDDKSHTIDAHVIYKEEGVLLRIKDDCIPFDPRERAAIADPEDPLKNIGTRMVMRLAKEVSYYNMLGLNVLTISLE